MTKLKSVAPTSKILVEIKLNYEDGSYKMMELKENQFIKNLTYIDDTNKEVTIDGVIKVIKTTEKIVSTANDCIHNTDSVFSKKVTPTAIVVDSSDVYESDIHVVNINKIVDISVDASDDMLVSDVDVIDSTLVSFRAASKPVCVLWNGELVTITETENDPGEYTFEVSTMKKVNSLIMFNVNNREVLAVDGAIPEIERSSVISEKVEEKSIELKDNVYNKFPNVPEVDVPESFYVEIASSIGAVDELTVGETVYVKDETIRLSVGNNGFIVAPAFKVENNALFLALPAIYTNADADGDIKISVNGFDFNIKAGIEYGRTISAGKVFALGTVDGYENEVSKTTVDGVDVITQKRQHGTSYVAWELFAGDEQLLTDTLVYTKTAYSDGRLAYGMTPLEKLGTVDNVLGKYNYYMNGPLDESSLSSCRCEYTVYAPGYGTGKFILVFEESVKA